MTLTKSIWSILFSLYSIFQLLGQSTLNENWSRFRGPNGQGVGFAESLPTKWEETDLAWKTKLPGSGHSSPVFWHDTVYVTSADNSANTGFLLAVSMVDGSVLWQKTFKLISYKLHPDNSYAAATPAVDKDHIYIIWYSQEKTVVIALDHYGKEKWQKNLDGVHTRHGPACSPIIVDDTIVFTMQQEGDSPFPSTWIGIDRFKGQVRWTLERETGERNSASTPCLLSTFGSKPLLLFTSQSHGFTGLDPVKGKVIWEYKTAFNHRTVASPVLWKNLIIGSCKNKLVAIEVNRMEDNDSIIVRYELERNLTPYVPTPIVVEDLLFIFLDNGNVACCRVIDGQLLWKEKPAGKYYGSPVLAGGNLYAVTMDGEVVVLKPSDKFKVIAINDLGEKSYATPAVSNNMLIFRTFSHLMAVGSDNR